MAKHFANTATRVDDLIALTQALVVPGLIVAGVGLTIYGSWGSEKPKVLDIADRLLSSGVGATIPGTIRAAANSLGRRFPDSDGDINADELPGISPIHRRR